MWINWLRKFLIGLGGALVIALGISLFTTTTASTHFYYSVTDLGTLGGTYTDAFSINDVGQVVGRSSNSKNAERAFFWENGNMTELITLGGINNKALDINNAGQVVGYASTPSPGHNHGVLWSNGKIIDLGTLGGNNSYAHSINNNQQVVGSSDTPKSVTAFFLQNGKMTGLGSNINSAYDINDVEQIAGVSTLNTSNGSQDALLLDNRNGTLTDLGNLGGKYSYPSSINNKGQVVGYSGISPSGSAHCFLWQNGTMSDISPSIGEGRSVNCFASSIHNDGKVVGTISTRLGWFSSMKNYPFVWYNGRLLGLKSLLPPNSSWQITSAQDINNKGQIVGSGIFNGQRRAVLLTPVRVTQ